MRRPRSSAILIAIVAFGCTRTKDTREKPPTAAADQVVDAQRAPQAASPRAIALSAGDAHTCALLSDGRVRCWGANAKGQLGLGTPGSIGDDEPANAAPVVPLGGTATAISAGEDHTCALLQTGTVRCWGRGSEGQLGYGRADNIGDDETPESVGDVLLKERVVEVAAGGNATCVLLESGAVRCWGDNEEGRLGFGSKFRKNLGDDEAVESVPAFQFATRPVHIASASGSSCASFDDGSVQCWGAVFGSEDEPAVATKTPSVDIGAAATTIHAASTSFVMCAVTATRAARCWGSSSALGFAEDTVVAAHSDVGRSPAQVGDLPLGGPVEAVAVNGSLKTS